MFICLDLLEEEDDDLLLSTIDLSAIEQQILSKSASNTINNLLNSKCKEEQIGKNVTKPSQSNAQKCVSSTQKNSNNTSNDLVFFKVV